MTAFQYIITNEDGEECLTVTIDGKPRVARSDSSRYEEIVKKVRLGDPKVVDLFDLAEAINKKFERLSERVMARNGRVYFDGDEINNGLTKQILRFIEKGVDDYKPLLAFFEKVQTNIQPESREQLYGFVERNEITITDNGDVVFYKGVNKDTDEGGKTVYKPTRQGYGVVDGIEYQSDYLPQYIGSVVEMPRTMVRHDPSSACSVGLHAATFSFAKSFSNAVLEIHVNPRDVVSVPQSDKVRVCRYVVVKEVKQAYTGPLKPKTPKKGAQKATGASKAASLDLSKAVTPSKPRFEELAATAKSQKKGVKALAEKQGWVLVGTDPKDRKSWKAPKKR